MKKVLFLAALSALIWFLCHPRPAHWRGIPAGLDPVQTADNLPASFNYGKYQITPLARYTIKAVVISRCRYRVDDGSDLAPLDLALGWGPVSIAGVLNELKISQSGRWYEYSWRGDPPLDPRVIATHSANTHCIPSSDAIRRQLFAIKRHDLVSLSGYLVGVSGPKGFHWRSSLSREDTGGGACELMWITGVERQKL